MPETTTTRRHGSFDSTLSESDPIYESDLESPTVDTQGLINATDAKGIPVLAYPSISKRRYIKWILLFITASIFLFRLETTIMIFSRQLIAMTFTPSWEQGHDVLIDLMKCSGKVIDKHKLTWWLDEGTLLGAVREGNIIKKDSDIDIAFIANEKHLFPQLSRDIEKECGFFVLTREDRKNMIGVTSFSIKRVGLRFFKSFWGPAWFIDVREYDVDYDGSVYDQDFTEDNDTMFLPLNLIEPIVDCKLRDGSFKCPADSISMIEDQFGSKWRTPIPGFKTFMLQREATYKLPVNFALDINGHQIFYLPNLDNKEKSP